MNENILLNFTRNSAIPLRVRKKAGKFFINPHDETSFTMPVFDVRYSGITNNHMDKKIYIYGLHEPATIRLMRNILTYRQEVDGQKPDYMDIGTNCGLHLICCAPLCRSAYGFEPWETVRKKAYENIEQNGLSHTKVFDFGLADKDSTLDFIVPKGRNHGVGTFAIEEYEKQFGVQDNDDGQKSIIKQAIKRGDTVVAEHGIKPALIKIDVEGLEKQVLLGLSETIKACRPAVVFEYSSLSRKDFDSQEALEKLFGADYSYWGILRSRERPVLRRFEPGKRYENVLAWPEKTLPDRFLTSIPRT